MAAGGRRVRRRHCEARQRLGLGGNVEGGEGILLPPHLGLEWSEEAARRWPAAAGGESRSGSTAQLGRRLEVAVGIVVVGKPHRGLFIGVEVRG